MSWRFPNLVPRSGPVILLILTLAAATGFAAVSHLVSRYNANQQARGRKLYAQGLAAASASRYDDAIAAFRAALTCDPANSQYQLSLARALRDSNDPRRLDEAESYLIALWQRTPQDAAVNLAHPTGWNTISSEQLQRLFRAGKGELTPGSVLTKRSFPSLYPDLPLDSALR